MLCQDATANIELRLQSSQLIGVAAKKTWLKIWQRVGHLSGQTKARLANNRDAENDVNSDAIKMWHNNVPHIC